MSAAVEYLDAEPNGLAAMVGGLIGANLERDPDRAGRIRPTSVSIDARDAEVAITLRLAPGVVRVANGIVPPTHLRIRADSEMLLGLSAVPLRFGLPDVLTAEGRSVVRKLLSRELRVEGLLRHPRRLAMLTSLLAVE